MKHFSDNHMLQPTTGESGTRVESNKEEETPAASLIAVDNHTNNDADTLAWEGFMSPVEDPYDLNMVTVVVEETEIEEEQKMKTDGFSFLSEIYPHSFRRYKEGSLSDLMEFGAWLKWDEDVIHFSDKMCRTLPLDLCMCLIREGHIDPDDDDTDDDDANLGDEIAPASAVEPEWENENNSTLEPPFLFSTHPLSLSPPP